MQRHSGWPRDGGYQEADMLWILFVGLVAGILARLISPGPNNPGGFILTIVLGVAGAFLATFIGQSIGWYHADQGAGFIAATHSRQSLHPGSTERRRRRACRALRLA
jgi:uncharacterized membrane protein YeaQ/YmgE (transglycosylase-associated protein family)